MTFAARSMQSLAGPVGGLGSLAVSDDEIAATAQASISFNTDGSITYIGNGSFGGNAWYLPVTSGIGSSYWIKFTLSSGAAWDAGLSSGTVYVLSSARSVQWTQAVVGSKTASVSVQIYSDAAGTVLVGSATISVLVAQSL